MGFINDPTFNHEDLDSGATTGNLQCEQPQFIVSQLESPTKDVISDSTNQNLENHGVSCTFAGHKTKSSKKLRKKFRHDTQEGTSERAEFDAIAREVMEVPKVAGLTTKGEETVLFKRIAKNLAAQEIGHQGQNTQE